MRLVCPIWPVRGPAASRLRLAGMLALAGLLTGVGLALGAEPAVSVTDPRLHLEPSQPAEGLLTVTDNTDAPISLVGAASPGCGLVALSAGKAGPATAPRPVRIEVPAHGSISFSSAGDHLICIGPAAGMRPGDHVPMTLTFADGRKVDAAFAIGTMAPAAESAG